MSTQVETRFGQLYRISIYGKEYDAQSFPDLIAMDDAGTLDPAAFYFHDAGQQWLPVHSLIGDAGSRRPPSAAPYKAAPQAIEPEPSSGFVLFFYLCAGICGIAAVGLGAWFIQADDARTGCMVFAAALFQCALFAAAGRAMEYLGFIHADVRALRKKVGE